MLKMMRAWEIRALAVSIKIVGVNATKRQLRALMKDFDPTSTRIRSLWHSIGKVQRDQIKSRMTSQGDAISGNWPALSKWTKARKGTKSGRKSALISERPRITYRLRTTGGVEIGYQTRDPRWNLSMHHTGYTKPPEGRRVLVPLKSPKWIGLPDSRTSITFVDKKPKVVPARNVWGTIGYAVKLASPLIKFWVAETIRRRVKGA